MPRVSVVIPSFNRAGFVGEAIGSVLAQTFTDFELIVVDDGSTDDTESVVARFGERVRYIRQENRGPGVARNTGLAAASGEWVSFLDSDDRMTPHNLATLTALLDAKPEVDVAYGWYFFMHETGELAPNLGGPKRWEAKPEIFPPGIAMVPCGPVVEGDVLTEMLTEETMFMGTSLIRKTRAAAIGGFRPLGHEEHWDFYLRLAEAGCLFACCKRGVMIMRMHRGNSGSQLDRMLANRLAILERFFANASLATRLEPVRACAYHNAYAEAAILSYKRRLLEQGTAWLVEALRYRSLSSPDESVFVHTLAAQALEAGQGQETAFVNEVFRPLASSGEGDRLRRKTLGRVNAELAASLLKRGQIAGWRHAWRALQADPSLVYEHIARVGVKARASAGRVRRSFRRPARNLATDAADRAD